MPVPPPSTAPRPAGLDSVSDADLLAELGLIESAIGRATTFTTRGDDSPVTVRISDELLRLADREHRISTELRRRHRIPPSRWSLDGLHREATTRRRAVRAGGERP